MRWCNQNGALLMADIKNIAPRMYKSRFVIEQRPTVGAGLLHRAACPSEAVAYYLMTPRLVWQM